jgi:hypothetical protein
MTPGTLAPTNALVPLSDHDANLDLLVDRLDLTPSGRELETIVRDIVEAFDRSWRGAEGDATLEQRLGTATLMSALAGELLALLVRRDGSAVAQLLQQDASQ